MTKRTDTGGTDWHIWDNKRNPSNPVDDVLFPNEAYAEADYSAYPHNFLSNGFSVDTTNGAFNASGGTYIFLAIAADPAPEPVLANSFNTVIWSADGTSGDIDINSVGFQPDFVWAKVRTQPYSHTLFDSVRGVGSTHMLWSDGNLSESQITANASNHGFVSSFNTDGFTGATGTTANSYFNLTGNDYVAWCWKAAGIPAINQKGTIDSIVSANPAAGFSIVTYTGNTTVGATIGHGLNNTPELIIFKRRNATNNWLTVQTTEGVGGYLDLTNIMTTSNYNAWMNNTNPTDTLITLNNYTYINGGNMLAYCFHSVDGYQKVGSYSGTGTTGNVINVGFKPQFIFIKKYK